jgi:predicted restriction endonuclease
VFNKYNYLCAYCGVDMKKDFDSWLINYPFVDHVVPKKHGGSENFDNLVAACWLCIKLKGQSRCASIPEGVEIIEHKKREFLEYYNKYVKENGHGN